MRTDIVSAGVVRIGTAALAVCYRARLTRLAVRGDRQGKSLADRRSRFTAWLVTMSLVLALMAIGVIAAGVDMRPWP